MNDLGLFACDSIGGICEDLNEHLLLQAVADPCSEHYDDLSGKKLDPKLVHAAYMGEIKGILEHGVWSEVAVAECIRETGKMPVWHSLCGHKQRA